MTKRTSSASAPTPKQVTYLRDLALQTGTTFSVPQTRRQASSEIERLKRVRATRGRPLEAPRGSDQAEEPYATAVHPSEVSGFGSQATWKIRPPAIVRTERQARAGERTELARYEVGGEERVVYGQRIAGCVTLTDRPASGSGRSFLIERGLEHDGYSALQALVDDYTQQARELEEIPMASSILSRELEQ
jgi:hypothetical protein